MFKFSIKEVVSNILRPGESLKWRTIQSSIVIVGGDGLKNVIRLGGNLIMTRLLYPEAFGLMLIVALFQSALAMLSDAGVRDAVVVKSRGREEAFMDTAWVVMISRGAILCGLSLTLAWPISIFYEQPILIGLIAINSVVPLIDGFSNPNRFIYERDIRQLPVMAEQLLSQSLMLIIGLVVLYFYPTVWVLAGFAVLGSVVRCALSYKIYEGRRPRFKVHKEAFSEIFNFGKWIFLATGLTFFATQGDRVFVSKLLTIDQLGVFSVAIVLAKVIELIATAMSVRLLVPVYAAVGNEPPQSLDKKVRKIKLGFCALFIPPVLFLAILGSWLIELMYDDRYIDAGWMLQVMVVGTLFEAFAGSLTPVMIGKGHVRSHLFLYVVRVFIYFAILFAGHHYFGLVGIVAGIAIAPMLIYFVYASYVMRYGIYVMKYDIPIFALFLTVIFACWNYFGWPIHLPAV